MKKLSALVLASALLLSACGGGEASQSSASASSAPAASSTGDAGEAAGNLTAPGEFPIVREQETISVYSSLGIQTTDYATNSATQWMEEKTNVHVEWVQSPEKDTETKLNLLLSSGDYPGVIFHGFDSSTVNLYASTGTFLPLDDLIATQGHFIHKVFEEYPAYREELTMLDGKIHSLPDINECYHCTLNYKLWLYTPWLEALNLSAPATTEEFYQMLKAFKEQDPNGNGQADEIPMAGAQGYRANPYELINIFTYAPEGNNFLRLSGGKVEAAYTSADWKDGVEFVTRLVAEGLYSTESFVQDRAQLKQMGENPDDVILGAAHGHWVSNWLAVDVEDHEGRWTQYKTIPPLKTPSGYQYASYLPTVANHRAYITDRCDNPETAMRWLDSLYDTEAALVTTLGEEGVAWDWAEDGDIGINGLPAIYSAMGFAQGGDNVNWSQKAPAFRNNAFRLGQTVNRDIPQVEVILFDETANNYEPYKMPEEWVLPKLIFSDEQAAELLDLENSLMTYVEESTAAFMTGNMSLSADWDRYLSELENIGLTRYLEIYQNAYDAKVS